MSLRQSGFEKVTELVNAIISRIPTGSSTNTDIKMNGTQSAGSSSNFAKADHVHPIDTSRAASSHSHGNLTNDGKLGSSANKPVITTTSGKVTTGSFGTAANTFCEGNDSRLSNARTPTSHAVSSKTYGGGTASNYGHVKLSDDYTDQDTDGAASNSVGASRKAVADCYHDLKNNKQTQYFVGFSNITQAVPTYDCHSKDNPLPIRVGSQLRVYVETIDGVNICGILDEDIINNLYVIYNGVGSVAYKRDISFEDGFASLTLNYSVNTSTSIPVYVYLNDVCIATSIVQISMVSSF